MSNLKSALVPVASLKLAVAYRFGCACGASAAFLVGQHRAPWCSRCQVYMSPSHHDPGDEDRSAQ